MVNGGASPYATDAKTGDTILHTAVEHSALEITKYILETFTDKDLINVTNRADYTPLQVLIGIYTEDGTEDDDEQQQQREEIPTSDLIIAKYLIRKGAVAASLPEYIMNKIKNVQEVQVKLEVNSMPPPPEPGISVVTQVKKEITPRTVPIESTAIALKFDNVAVEELTNILRVDDLWRKTAMLLDMESLVSVWESTSSPVRCLLDYIQVG